MFKNKKNAKIVAVAVVVFFVLGIVGIVVSQNAGSYAAPSSNIGKVNYDRLVSEHPDLEELQKRVETEREKAGKDFEEKSANMNDQQKAEYYQQVGERLNLKIMELQAPLFDKINASIKAVAESKKIEVVFDNRSIHYGGVDLTDDVLKQMKK